MNEKLMEAHRQLVALMGDNGQGAAVTERVTNFGDHRVTHVDYNCTVFYPEYRTQGPDSQRTCETFGAETLEGVVEKAAEFIKKEYA